RVLVAGGRGLVGSAIVRRLRDEGFVSVFAPRSDEVDLTDREATARFVAALVPDVVVDAAARVGGIAANAA
ncbi:NAD-dependent epimerase/dehydratase family protein, partial [Campylobacter jejuni]